MNFYLGSGRTTKDIELKYSQDNTAVARFSLAVDSGFGDNKKTSFLNCVAFKNTAESMEKHVKKGTKIIIQAEVMQNNYTDRDGNNRTSFDFIVRSWEFAESKAAGSQEQAAPTPMPKASMGNGFMNFDDDLSDLPFQ